jgi:hypothetical protein
MLPRCGRKHEQKHGHIGWQINPKMNHQLMYMSIRESSHIQKVLTLPA